jgi:hypothetical protein
LVRPEGGAVFALLRYIEQRQHHAAISESTAIRYLKEMNFTFKRYRYRSKNGSRRRSTAYARKYFPLVIITIVGEFNYAGKRKTTTYEYKFK